MEWTTHQKSSKSITFHLLESDWIKRIKVHLNQTKLSDYIFTVFVYFVYIHSQIVTNRHFLGSIHSLVILYRHVKFVSLALGLFFVNFEVKLIEISFANILLFSLRSRFRWWIVCFWSTVFKEMTDFVQTSPTAGHWLFLCGKSFRHLKPISKMFFVLVVESSFFRILY